MATVIYTGNPNKCKVIHLMECPACGDAFEFLEGRDIYSHTVGDKVTVCAKHSEFTAGEEIRVQTSLDKALKRPGGHVTVAGKVVKK